MLKKNKISVIVPSYNEEKLIGTVIKSMPDFVDLIIIVDDHSDDHTIKIAEQTAKRTKKSLQIIHHKSNQGVGAAIVTGYKYALKHQVDISAVMAGDAQMDPLELKSIVLPIINDQADYSKGNRLSYSQAWSVIPKTRYLGNSVLSLFTKITSGYWHIADSQTGYTAISKKMLQKINLDQLYKRYGFPNDLLVHLNVANARVKEVAIKPIYNIGEKSGIKLWRVIPTISWLLVRRFFWRLKVKYIIEDFHPLVFFYSFGFILSLANIILAIRLFIVWADFGRIPPINALALVFCGITASQFLFFAMWFDMDYNKELRVK